MTRQTTSAATVLTGAILLGLAALGPAAAAPGTIDREATKLADAAPARAGTEAEEDETANCSRSRKRLWVESEGWVVRKVTICR